MAAEILAVEPRLRQNLSLQSVSLLEEAKVSPYSSARAGGTEGRVLQLGFKFSLSLERRSQMLHICCNNCSCKERQEKGFCKARQTP